DRGDLYLVYDVRRERVGVAGPSRFRVDAPGAEIEHRVLVELSNRGGVVTLHVVGEDLQARRAVDERLLRQEGVLVRLSRDRLLRILADVDVPVEHAPG